MDFKPVISEDDLLNRIQSDIEQAFLNTGPGLFKPGDIKLSVLSENSFKRIHGKNWVLCDGRSIRNTDLARIAGITDAPDFRGRYIRGASNDLLSVYTSSAGSGGSSTLTINFFIRVS